MFRWWGYYGAHLRALIWDAFSCRAAQPRGFPLGGKLSPKVTDEGAILSPTFPCRKIGLSPRRLSSPAPLGNPVAPHPPQCAHWGTFPRGRLWGWRHSGLEPFFHKHAFQRIFLENASQIGLGIPEETAPLSYQRQRSPKRANESERAMTPGVQGQSPGPLSPHFSGEMGTPAGRRGNGVLRPEAPEKPRPPAGYAVPPPRPRPHLRAPTPSGTNRTVYSI